MGLIIALLLSMAGPESAPLSVRTRVAVPTLVVPPSPQILHALSRFDAAVVTERAAYQTLPIAGGLGPNLAARVTFEQAMRRAASAILQSLDTGDRAAVGAVIWQRIGIIDAENTAYLKSILPADGWFRSHRDGPAVAHDAWLILQHSPDLAFQGRILALLPTLLAAGDIRGADYALLYDRVEMLSGRPQLYGSQVRCKDGHWQIAPTLNPAMLDKRRASIGLGSVADYLGKIAGACGASTPAPPRSPSSP